MRLVHEQKPGGSNPGLIFDVDDNGTTKRFYLKSNAAIWGLLPDIRELVLYFFLEQIGVGPAECHFIPNAAKSKSVIYIATLEVLLRLSLNNLICLIEIGVIIVGINHWKMIISFRK